MKQTVYFLLLCFSVFCFSCSDDDKFRASVEQENAEKGYKRSIVSFKEMKLKLSSLDGKAISLFSNAAHKGGDDYIQSIDSTYIIQFTNDTLTTYTLRVSTLDDENYSYSNLIIRSLNGETEEFIAHYAPTETWQEAHDSGEYLEYDGVFELTDVDGEKIGSNVEGKGTTMYCTFSVEPNITPCYGESCPCPPPYNGTLNGYNVIITCQSVPTGGSSGGGTGGGGDGPGDDPTGPGGGLPTDPNTGAGANPCQSLNQKLMDSNFRIKIMDLKNNLNTESEKGWTNYEENGANNKYEAMVDGTRSDGIRYVQSRRLTMDVIGYAHSHTIRPDKDMPIPSVTDFNGFIELVNRRLDFGKSTAETYVVMVGIHGDGHQTPRKIRTYALKVDNLSNLEDWLLEYDTKDKRDAYFLEMKIKEKEIHKHPNNEEENEKAILDLLGACYGDLGLGIYKANDSFTGWSRMAPDGFGGVDYTTCN